MASQRLLGATNTGLICLFGFCVFGTRYFVHLVNSSQSEEVTIKHHLKQ